MESYFVVSGVKHELDLFETIMQSQIFFLPFKDKDGTIKKQPIYGNLAPIRFYRFIYPKEHHNEVVKMLSLDGNQYSQLNLPALSLRKILGLKPFKKVPECTPTRFFPENLNLAIKGIGWKEDKEISYDGVTHEGI